MTEMPFPSGSVFRRRLVIRNALLQACSGIAVGFYLFTLLQLSARQWREFLIAAAALAGLSALAGVWRQRRFDRSVVTCIDAQARSDLHQGNFQSGFEAVIDLPRRMFLAVQMNWAVAAIAIPGWMMLRRDDLTGSQSASIAIAALVGGIVTGILVFFSAKRFVAPLGDEWALQLRDCAQRQGLIRRLSLSRKFGIAVGGVTASTVIATALLFYSLGLRPIEGYSTRVQSGYIGRVAERVGDRWDRSFEGLADELDGLGVAGQLLIVDLRTGEIVSGPPEALTARELRWIAASEEGAGTSLEIDSSNSFAWSRIETDENLALVAVAPRELLVGDLGRAWLAFGVLLLVALAIALIAALLIADDVSHTTEWVRREAGRIASGDLTRGETREAEDELGDLARSFEAMADSLRATVGRVADAAQRVEGEATAITTVGSSVASATREQVEGIKQVTSSMAAIDEQVSGIAESVQVLNGNVEEASSSILELGAAGEQLNQTASSLTSQVDEVSGSIEEMVRSGCRVSDNTEALADAVSETSASMAQMADSMQQVGRAATETAGLSSQVVSLAERGRERVQQTIAGMDVIREVTSRADTVIRSLGHRVQEIGAIVDVIDDVADETNLLALNAAIIAAQAGDQGRAFSVVADEIKDLADRVLTSTKEISALIRSVQEESSNAVGAIERGTESVQGGVELSAEAGASLEEITRAARASGMRIEEIFQTMREQAKEAKRVSDLMGHVNRRVEEIRAGVGEQERGNEILMRGTVLIRDVAQQTHRTTEEQARGVGRIQDSIESVRETVGRIHTALQEQSEACRQSVSLLGQIYQRTRSNEDSTRRMREATQGLQQEADALRENVWKFRIE